MLFGGRSPDRAQALAGRTGSRAGTPAEAAAFGDVTLLALPYDAVAGVIPSLGDLRDRALIDCTNAIGPGCTLTTGDDPGAARPVDRRRHRRPGRQGVQPPPGPPLGRPRGPDDRPALRGRREGPHAGGHPREGPRAHPPHRRRAGEGRLSGDHHGLPDRPLAHRPRPSHPAAAPLRRTA
ncbi:hypothetical protein F5983_20525 [Streptomyces arboris]|uniref:Pyrroline-5-carboxylate reductase catalytic N-terminal domain-containing protein n=1 Tax=Streptomyces arboris TaxID=2600619 RepID=A0A5N5EPR0_9ACTN|nr:hypothetical protein F5983_20525 [Streptomyces arboris]